MATFTFSANDAEIQKLDQIARETDTTRSQLIRKMIRQLLDDHQKATGQDLFTIPKGRPR
jgi:predicted transcriptional regulator